MIPALYAAGVAMALVNFVFARLTLAPFYEGEGAWALLDEEFFRLLPVVMGMLLIGVLTAVLIDVVGSLAVVCWLSYPDAATCDPADRAHDLGRASSTAPRRCRCT